MLIRHLLQQKIILLEPFSENQTAVFVVSVARELLPYMDKIGALEKIIATPVTSPYCSASPVCGIEAGYVVSVNDCREAIWRVGYPIEGDDQFALTLTNMCL